MEARGLDSCTLRNDDGPNGTSPPTLHPVNHLTVGEGYGRVG